MSPHHSDAILTCERASIHDSQVGELSTAKELGARPSWEAGMRPDGAWTTSGDLPTIEEARRTADMIQARDQLLRDVSHELRSPVTRLSL